MHTYRSHRGEKGLSRWHLHTDKGLGLNIELSRRWRSGLIATVGYGGQEHFADATFAVPRLFFANIQLETPLKWKRLRPRDGKYGESEAEWGIKAGRSIVRLLFGHDPMGTHYGGRRAWRQTWMNRELYLFNTKWVVGRDRYTNEVLDERPVEIVVGRWPIDWYAAIQRIERSTWKNRFRTKKRVSYQWSIENGDGIPTDTKGKWGDRYGETLGFGAEANQSYSVGQLIEAAPDALAERLPSLLREWPKDYVPDEFKEVAG